MDLILATNHLGLGGSESYLLTVAEQLERLGNEVTLYTRDQGVGADLARARGIAVVDESNLPEDCDAVLAQDAGASYELASRYPAAPQVFVAHSETFDLQTPPQIEQVVSTVVALNDRVADRLRGLAVEAEMVRLRQPIDIERFTVRTPLPAVARRALLLSNNPVADRLPILEHACRAAGLELVRVGGDAGQTGDPRASLAGVEIVIGVGRSVLEAMACGRAAYIYDRYGGDGWVTADAYPALEADGFGGRGDRVVVDAARLGADLRDYSASMGPVNRDLVVANHRANVHAQALVELIRGLAPARRPRRPLDEMARLVRLEWRAQLEAHALRLEIARLQAEPVRLEAELTRLRAELDEREQEAARSQEATAETRRSFESSLSWRITRPLRAASAIVRRRRA